MVNANVIYRVTGRYMDGQKIVGYHLVGEDGSQAQENKDRVIYLIRKGMIANMRIQTISDDEVIIRGKGINLNKLPVYDSVKQKFRDNAISQEVANGKVNTDSVDISKMGQYTITRRIMKKNNCLGYELRDYSGHVTRKTRDEVIQLAVQRLVSNATVHKVVDKDSNETKLILRGVGAELRTLPYLMLDENGKLINPNNRHNMTVRVSYMPSNGILRNNATGGIEPFKAGQYIVCMPSGEIKIQTQKDISEKYNTKCESTSAVCDYYVADDMYSIEIFGEQTIKINQQLVQSFSVFELK